MGRIADRFAELKSRNHKALVVYLMGGDPNLEITAELIRYLEELGVDVVEIGVPFSDPLADGPVIQEAGQRALKTTLRDLLEMVGNLRGEVNIPLLLMTYYNPIFRMGAKRFVETAQKAGLDGLIVPDLTPEEDEELFSLCVEHGIDPILLFAPTTSDKRMDLLAGSAHGFIYYVSRTGTTGAKNDLSADLEENLGRIHSRSSLPVAVGFGISTPDQAGQVGRFADGVIIGSAVVRRIAEGKDDLARIKNSLDEFLTPIIERLHAD